MGSDREWWAFYKWARECRDDAYDKADNLRFMGNDQGAEQCDRIAGNLSVGLSTLCGGGEEKIPCETCGRAHYAHTPCDDAEASNGE